MRSSIRRHRPGPVLRPSWPAGSPDAVRRNGLLLPAGLRVIGRPEAHGLDLMDLAATDLEDMGRGQIEGWELHWYAGHARIADDVHVIFLHGMPELRQAEYQARLGIRNPHAARLDALDV